MYAAAADEDLVDSRRIFQDRSRDRAGTQLCERRLYVDCCWCGPAKR